MANYLYGRRVKLVLKSPKATFEYKQTLNHSLSIQFTVPFSDSSTPSECTVTIMNLAQKHRDLFKVGGEVELYAGYAEDSMGLLSSGTISKISPFTSDGTNSNFTFFFREGKDYSNILSSAQKANAKAKAAADKKAKAAGKKSGGKYKKQSALSFVKGSKASTIIRRIASDAGITLDKVYLKKNKVYKKGYTSKGKPLSNIKTIAKDCGSKVYYRRGSILIDDLSKLKGHNESILITEKLKGHHGGTGLTSYPTTDADSISAKHQTWTIVSLLRHQVSVGSVIQVNNRFLNGTFRVKSGEHQCDDGSFTTTLEVYV